MKYENVIVGMRVKVISGFGAGKLIGKVVSKQKQMPTLAGTMRGPVVVISFGPESGAKFVKSPEQIEPI